jgi:hypothetical protein
MSTRHTVKDAPVATMIAAESDARVGNNEARHQYRTLNAEEKLLMVEVKDAGQALIDLINGLPPTDETRVAKERAIEATMWAVRSITA